MKSKAAFIVGTGIGYVLGTRAGRRQFESIKSHALGVWHSDSVQSTVSTVQDKAAEVAKEQGAALKDKVTEAVRSATSGSATGSHAGSADPDDAPRPAPGTGTHQI